ncbi:hypothetical protein AX16_008170 [Volvariella volvacea WC 439]|nr:hypothetical protein AX16_008170 [Volvariella volvacea WC 439]
MFQVAHQPASFDMSYNHHSSGHVPTVQLPRTLARPAFVDVSPAAIQAVAPELAAAGVPIEYIRDRLRRDTEKMLAGISALSPSHLPPSLPRSHIPPSLAIPLRQAAPDQMCPTHILAVSSAKSTSDQATIFPVHALVLASHCSSLPPLRPAAQASSSALTLPVLPLAVPSAAAFAVLHSYMYNHRLDLVLKALFPVPSGFLTSLTHANVRATLSSQQAIHQLAGYLCQNSSSNLQKLSAHAAHVKDVWQDMVSLGLFDHALWDTIDLAWEVVLAALNLAAASR